MNENKILIIDEQGFSRICSAILSNDGFQTEIASITSDIRAKLSSNGIGLIVTSYPYSSALLESLQDEHIPIIILTDGIDERLIGMLNKFQNSCCMIKPINYDRFKQIVKQSLENAQAHRGGYCIV